jgi:hypothetical protein
MGLVQSNGPAMKEEVKDWPSAPTPRILIVGALQDGLAFDSAYAAVIGKPRRWGRAGKQARCCGARMSLSS